MKKQVIITGDINDGDYITNVEDINDEQEKLILKIVSVISKKKSHNWADEYDDYDHITVKRKYEDELSEEEIDDFIDMLPTDENCVIHTISTLKIIEIAKETDLI